MANQVDIIIRAVDKGVKKSFFGLAGNVKKSKAALDAFDASMKRASRSTAVLSGRLKTAFTGIGAGVVAQQLFQAGVAAERLTLAFKAITGNVSEAAAELAFVRKISSDLGLEFYKTADAYKGIFAASRGTNLQGEATRKIFVGIAEATAALGLSAPRSAMALKSVSQMISKGKVMAEELRQQLGEHLPGAFQLMARAAGVSTAELNDMLEAGEVGLDILPKFADILHEKYGKAAAEASKKAIGTLNNWKTAWMDLKIVLANSGFLEESTSLLQRMTDSLKDPAVQAAIKVWAERFFDLAGAVAKMAWEYKGWIAGVAGTVVVTSILTKMAITVVALHKAFLVLTGMKVGAWFASVATGLKAVQLSAMSASTALGAAAAATLALVGGYKAGEWLTMHKHWQAIADQQKENAAASKELAARYREISQQTGLTITSMEDLDKAVKDGLVHFDEASAEWVANHKDIADAGAASAQAQERSTTDALEAMKKQYKDYADEVKRLQDDIARREQSLAEQLRSLGREGMSESNAWRDRRAEAQEYEAAAIQAAKKAQAALEAGDKKQADALFKQAIEHADNAKEAYADLNEEVKDGDKVIISGQAALETAMAGVESAGKLAIDILGKQKSAAEEAMAALDNDSGGKLSGAIDAATEATRNLDQMVYKVGDTWHSVSKAAETSWIDAAMAAGKELDKMAIDRTIKLYIEKIEKNQTGGLIGTVGMMTGGLVKAAAKMAAGGANIRNAVNGFHFPGYGGGDRPKNLVMAEDGEVMIRKEMVKRAGLRAALAFNAGRFDILLSELMARFSPAGIMMKQLGGLIAPQRIMPEPLFMSGGGQVAGSGSGGGSTMNVNLNLPVSGPPIQTTMRSSQATELLRQLQHMGSSAA